MGHCRESGVTSVALDGINRVDDAPGPLLDAARWVEHAPSAAFAIDVDGRITAVNDALAALLGCEATQLLGRELVRWGADAAALRDFLAAKASTTAELRFRAADASERCLALSIAPSTLGGGRVVTAVDVTETRANEQRLREDIERFRDMIGAGSGWFHETDETQTRIRVFRSGAVNKAPTMVEMNVKFPEEAIDMTFNPEGIAEAMRAYA